MKKVLIIGFIFLFMFMFMNTAVAGSEGFTIIVGKEDCVSNDRLPEKKDVKEVAEKIEKEFRENRILENEEIRVTIAETQRAEGLAELVSLPYWEHHSILLYPYPEGADNWTWSKAQIEKVVLHEIGHIVDFKYMEREDFIEYLKIRGVLEYEFNGDEKERYSVWERSENELIAEDFAVIFGNHQHDNLTAFPEKSESQKGELKKYILDLIQEDRTETVNLKDIILQIMAVIRGGGNNG